MFASETGTSDHGQLTGLADDDHLQYLLIDGTRAMTGALDMGTNAITNVGNVDGRDVSVDGATLDSHIADSTIHFTVGSIDHTAILNVGTNTHAQIDSHIADSTIHFTVGSIDHTAIANIGTNTHAQIDSHIADSTIHFTVGSIDHTAILNVGTNTHAQIDSHIADSTIHFTVGSIDHTAIANIGTNTHAQIDSHIADSTIHFTVGSIDHTAILNVGTNTHAQIDSHIADSTIHFTVGSIDHTAILNVGTNTHAQIDSHIADATIHFTEASIDHTAITNIGTNTHAQIDTHIADSTIHFTEASIDHGSIAGLADDDHTQYLLINGTRAMTGALQVAQVGSPEDGGITSGAFSLQLTSGASDGATAVAAILDTTNTFSNSGAKTLSLRNGGTEVFYYKPDIPGITFPTLGRSVEMSAVTDGVFGDVVLNGIGSAGRFVLENSASQRLFIAPNSGSIAAAVSSFLLSATGGASGTISMTLDGTNSALVPSAKPAGTFTIGRGNFNTAGNKFHGLFLADSGPVYFGNGAVGTPDANIQFNGTDLAVNTAATGSGLWRWNNANNFTATGGGSAPTLGTLPSGPAAAQATWLTMKDNSGNTIYVPVWR